MHPRDDIADAGLSIPMRPHPAILRQSSNRREPAATIVPKQKRRNRYEPRVNLFQIMCTLPLGLKKARERTSL